jgi:prolactin regulatory element-binding protein
VLSEITDTSVVTRFGLVEGDVNNTRLFMLVNPVGRQGRQKAFLQLWLPKDGSLKKAVPCNDSLSALAVSDDGRFVAVGTMFSGSVSVYIAFSLQVQVLVSIIFVSFYRIILK